MTWLMPAITLNMIGTILLTSVYAYLYFQYRENFMGVWAVSWAVYAIRFIIELFIKVNGTNNIIMLLAHQLSILVSGVLLFWGASVFTGRNIPRWAIYSIILNVLWVGVGSYFKLTWSLLNSPTFLITSLIFIWIGVIYLRSHDMDRFGRGLTGWGFVLWGLHRMNYPFLSVTPVFAPFGYLAATVLEITVAVGALLVYFVKIRQILGENERRFRLLAENAQDIIYRYRIDSQPGFEYVSPSVVSITGHRPEDFYNDPDLFFRLVHEDDSYIIKDTKLLVGVTREPFSLRLLRKNGSYIWTEHLNVPVLDSEGKIIGFEGIARDITERKEAEGVVNRYRHLSEHARDIIVFFARDGKIIDVNEAAASSYGYDRSEILKLNFSDLGDEPHIIKNEELLKEAGDRSILYEAEHKRQDGSIFPVEVSLQGTVQENQFVFFAIVRDITERKRAEETINYLAFHDPLTDLPNRLLFFDRLNTALTYAKRNHKMLAVMFLDLDRFKFVNDVMGHAMGDRLLVDVARKLSDCIRANDTVARIGGDEFTILLPEINREEDASKVAEKIIQNLKKPWVLDQHEIHITTSIGIGLYPNDGQDAETLTKNADTAMYRAKEQGDNYQFYTPAMNEKALERIEIEQALRKALEQGEFEVYFQPQVNIRDGRISGMEALLRWHHPEKGIKLPGEFISVAEDTALIISIGEWVLRKACSQSMEWQNKGYNRLRVSVNISACQFRQKQLVDTVSRVLQETGMDPCLLELEITESTAMQDVEFTIETLRKLRNMGVHIAIDDFGTGYSSLSYLRRFPVNTLKVDRSFVRDVLTDVEDAAIVATIVVLAQNLKLRTVIEGVENEEQVRFFAQQDCYIMQGYLFSKPATAEAVEMMLKHDLYLEQKLG